MTTVDDRSESAPSPASPETPESSGLAAFARIGAVIAAAVVLAVVLHGVAYLVVVLALVVMVMVHELGHYLAAKVSGMKVTEYFFGFGPRLWSFVRGETRYGVKAIPAGGYVRIVGMTMLEEVAPEDELRSYRQSTFPRRVLVAVAGSFMHAVMAFLLLFALLAVVGAPEQPITRVTAIENFVGSPSPAAEAGFRAGDVFVSIDGHAFTQSDQFIAYIQSHADKRLTVVVRRNGADVTLHVRPANGENVRVRVGSKIVSLGYTSPTGVIGVHLDDPIVTVRANPVVGVGRAVRMLGSLTASTATGITQVFSLSGLRSFAHQVASAGAPATGSGGAQGSTSTSSSASSGSGGGQIMSILGAVQVGAQAASSNVGELLYLLAAINVFVGMINLFPMLPLDGGHVAIAIYERIRSRRGRRYHADVAKLMPLAYLFLLFMVVIGIGALYANIRQPVVLPN